MTTTTTRPALTALSEPAAQAAIASACRSLGLPTVRAQAAPIAEAAARERLTHSAYLAEVLAAECDDREARRRIRRVKEARSPRLKRALGTLGGEWGRADWVEGGVGRGPR